MLSDVTLPLAFLVLAVAAYIDIKTREVPDWITYGLMFAGIGIRIIYSYAEQTWIPLGEGVVGLIAMFLLSCILFYTGQWGGGDSKLLIGLGALFGVTWTTPIQFMSFFLLLLFAAGAVYGMIWSLFLFVKHWQKCLPSFLQAHKLGVGRRNLIWGGSISIMILAVFFAGEPISFLFVVISLAILILYYIWLFLLVLEKLYMQRAVDPVELTEGDWIVNDIVVDGKRVCGPADLGIEKKQIALLKRYYAEKKIGKILIKEGLPFVPSFFIAYLALLGLRLFFQLP